MDTSSMKYGENLWQGRALFIDLESGDALGLDTFSLVAGSKPSYTNITDIDRLLQVITHIAAAFDVNRGAVPHIAVAGKHGNACGAAVGSDRVSVMQRMIGGDTRAIFGGAVMTNFPVDEEVAHTLSSHMTSGSRRLLDLVIAPEFAHHAIRILERKDGRCKFFANSALAGLNKASLDAATRFRYVRGGILRQENYTFILDLNDPRIEKSEVADGGIEEDLMLAWAIGSTSNSNTVTLVKNGMLIGDGVGQQDRVGACALAIARATCAGHDLKGAAAYSDSFFPFTDGPEVLAGAGIRAILASSGSVKDDAVRGACGEKGVILYLIPDAMGRGFFGH